MLGAVCFGGGYAAQRSGGRSLFCVLVQTYTGTGADGTTERNFKVHLQLWDTAGQER